MTSHALSASKIALAYECPGAFALPHLDQKHPGQDEGVEGHAEQEDAIGRGEVPDEFAARWPGYTWRAEIAFAIDLATGVGREIGSQLQRAYGNIGPLEVVGTADAVGRGPNGELAIVDKKRFDPNVKRAAKNAQLHTLALAACRAYGVDSCEVAIQHEARPFDVATLDTFDLDTFLVELRGVLERVAQARVDHRNGTLQLSPGSHCRWCPAFMGKDGIACPAQRKIQEDVAQGLAMVRVEASVPFQSDEQAADAYDFLAQLKTLTKRLTEALYARAGERPIPLRSGRMFGPVEKLGNEKLDGDIAYTTIRNLYGQETADAAVTREATKSKIREALKARGAGNVAAAERKVLEAVRAAGGAERKTKIAIEEYEPQQLLRVVND